MYLIGIMYRDGEGVPKDEKKAHSWFQTAIDYGYWPAIEELKLHLVQPEIITNTGQAETFIYIGNKWIIDGWRAKKIENLARLYKADIKF